MVVMSIINGQSLLGKNDKNDDDQASGYGRDNADIGGVCEMGLIMKMVVN